MLSLEDVRNLIPNQNLTDQEVGQLRDEIRALAEIILENWRQDRGSPKVLPSEARLARHDGLRDNSMDHERGA